ncbi:AMP-binding protein [Geomonas sp. Red69]|uniref:AMP-binding protein n=1 Tax=Geomonas diazotrophica TaxID=2843197 RepID=A0ABX8JEI7_9BACT|nr:MULTISPECIES: AMP-binding protein [Geomonas]MBU5636004.1 AMP-binding protein [Geomonas diazotrophica]QWV96818.1 AMP-binding protein [Geomonas nitrogeniifigens]QXE85918.1 AMP-binding protein [Geomonas nitrogeniifigens]
MEDVIANQQHNIGDICTRQQCLAGRGGRLAFRFINVQGERQDFTFLDLDRESSRFANVLQKLGFAAGDVFFTFLPKMPEQFFSFLGALKLNVIVGTLFSNFGDDALLDRLGDSNAKGILLRKSALKKLGRIRERLPALSLVLVVDADADLAPDILSYRRLMREAAPEFTAPVTGADTPSVLHYTSGSTGKPKGVLHRHGSIVHQSRTGREVLQLGEEDTYWCTADQGWVTGTSYGIIAPWSLGATQIHYGGGYDAGVWFDILEQEKVTVWYTAPTALRMLMREEESVFKGRDLNALRHVFSVGEPLNPEVVRWGAEVLDRQIYDTWFQTETGGIMVSNRPGLPVLPGSMGKPVRGVEAAILSDSGVPLPDGAQGHLCLKPGWESMFVTYLNNEAAYHSKFKNGYYYSGDTAYRDGEGYFHFMGRSDDVINTAGHLISPFEVESALLEIPEVAESGVIGAPDELLFEKVVAFVSLHDGCSQSPELELKIRLHVANRASSIATPQEIFFVASVPKNKSGKIMRRVLKARYLGTDTGDISTLEDDV